MDEADMLHSMKNLSTCYFSFSRFDVCSNYVRARVKLRSQAEVDGGVWKLKEEQALEIEGKHVALRFTLINFVRSSRSRGREFQVRSQVRGCVDGTDK
jgi:hypothetical protein